MGPIDNQSMIFHINITNPGRIKVTFCNFSAERIITREEHWKSPFLSYYTWRHVDVHMTCSKPIAMQF
jgi:hypothetical protein